MRAQAREGGMLLGLLEIRFVVAIFTGVALALPTSSDQLLGRAARGGDPT